MISTPQSQFLSSPTTTLTPPSLLPNLLLFSSHPFTQPLSSTRLPLPPRPVAHEMQWSSPMESSTSLQFNSPSPELPPTQPMTVDTNDVVPPCSSPRVQGQLPSIQVRPPETSGVNSCMHEDGPGTNLEIIDELRKAQARVRFLKKKLRQRGISNKRNMLNHSSRSQHLFSKSSEATDLLTTRVSLDENSSMLMKERTEASLGGYMIGKNLMKKHTMRRIPRKKKLPDKSVTNLCKLQERKNSESGEYVQQSTHSENGLEREEEEDSMDEIFKMKNSETFQEQMHSMNLLNHLNSQYNVIAPNSNMWDCKRCILRGPEGRCSNGCSSMEGSVSENSTLLQELEGDLFAQKSHTDDPFSSQRHEPLVDALGPVYSQSTAMTLVKPGDERGRLSYLQSGAGHFKCSLGQEFSEQALMISNLAAESAINNSDSLLHLNTAVDMLEPQLCQPSFIQHQYHSSYFDSKQIPEQDNSADHCGSDFLLHQPSSNCMMHSRHVAGFDYECPRAQQHSLQTSAEGLFYGGITECKSGDEIWKQESSEEQRLMEGLLAETLWAEDETFSLDRYTTSVVNTIEANNWNSESRSG